MDPLKSGSGAVKSARKNVRPRPSQGALSGLSRQFHATAKKEVLPLIGAAFGIAVIASGMRYLIRAGKRMRELEEEERKKGGPAAAVDGANDVAAAYGKNAAGALMGPAFGVDMGTISLRTAFADAAGKAPSVIENREGSRWTPGVVSFGAGRDPIIGQLAKAQRWKEPLNTIFNVQPLVGAKFDSPIVQTMASRYKFTLKPAEDGGVGIDASGWQEGGMCTPEVVCTLLLKNMKELAEFKVHAAGASMVAVPELYTAEQTDVYLQCAKAAGMIVIGSIEASVAAVTAAVENGDIPKGKGLIAVLDMGGRSTSCSIVDMDEEGNLKVVGKEWTPDVGGDMFEDILVQEMDRSFAAGHPGAASLLKDELAIARLYEAAEAAKMDLSQQASTAVNIPYITADMTGPKHLEAPLTRAKFERDIDALLYEAEAPCKAAMASAGVQPADLAGVLVVGGCSRMPSVQSLARRVFKTESVVVPVHSEELTVLGTTIAARRAIYES